ncbi:Gti1/Pac2 family-domain-containing protein [Fomitopsis betulina]|nr:Gti1/Pac2 family-domain-containing protein [Fomitopsis betulina]
MPVPVPARTEPQQPTWREVRIKRSEEAKLVMHAVALKYAPLIHSRLQEDERRAIVMEGSVFVWEERDEPSETNGSAIIRWTDGRRWGPSRVQGEFLIYHENLPALPPDINEADRNEYIASRLIKQTFSARVDVDGRRKKWHLVAYYTQRADRQLPRVFDVEPFRSLRNTLPPHQYESARASRPRGRGSSSQSEEADEDDSDPSSDALSLPTLQVPAMTSAPPASSSVHTVNQTHGEAPLAGHSQILHSTLRAIPAAFAAPASGSMGSPATVHPPTRAMVGQASMAGGAISHHLSMIGWRHTRLATPLTLLRSAHSTCGRALSEREYLFDFINTIDGLCHMYTIL